MSEVKNPSITSRTNQNNSTGGRGDRRGRSSRGSSQSGRSHNQHSRHRHGRGGRGRGSQNHSRQPRQQGDSQQNNKHHQQHKNNHNQRPRSHSHHKKDYKKSIEGPYAHLFCSERHGFALSRVLYPKEETVLSSCFDSQSKITSAQLEKWWDCVKLVRCHVSYDETANNTSSLDRCPICLDEEMISPHIGPCGHTFCLPCVLGYLNSVAKGLNAESDRISKTTQKMEGGKSVVGRATKVAVAVTTVRARCPMCSSGNSSELNAGDAMITYRDLRPVVFTPVSTVRAKAACGGKHKDSEHLGTRMRFVKLHRVIDSLAPYLPLEGRTTHGVGMSKDLLGTEQCIPDFPDGDDDAEGCIYTRQYFLGCNEYDTLLQRRLSDLIKYRDESVHCQMDHREKWNVAMATEAAQASLRRWLGGNGADDGFRFVELEAKLNSTKDTAMLVPTQLKHDLISEGNTKQTTDLIQPGTVHLNREENECLYYQACDGQLCFLSGINMTCLIEEFSIYHNDQSMDEPNRSRNTLPLPDVVEGTIIGLESMIVTPDLVKRKHFLSNLPLGSSVVFAEIDWYSGGKNCHKPMLTRATLNKFRGEIQRRKSDRQRAYKIEQENDRNARSKQEKEERIRRIEAFGAAHIDGLSQQVIDPDDDFFKAPSPSMEEELQTTAFRFNQVCAEGGEFPELASNSSVARVPANTSLSQSPSSSLWGDGSNRLMLKQSSAVPKPPIEAFPALTQTTQTKMSCNQKMDPKNTSRGSKTCWNK